MPRRSDQKQLATRSGIPLPEKRRKDQSFREGRFKDHRPTNAGKKEKPFSMPKKTRRKHYGPDGKPENVFQTEHIIRFGALFHKAGLSIAD